MLSLTSILTLLLSTSSALTLQPRQSTTPRYLTLPSTPLLPTPISTTYFEHDSASLWYQTYNLHNGTNSAQPPLVLIHGGLGYSAYMADVAKLLIPNHPVILLDRRGHGRSTIGNNATTWDFPMFASDTHLLLLTSLNISSSIWIGWSDGAATTLAGLLDTTISATISKAVVFAGFQSASDTNTTFTNTDIYEVFVGRCQDEYASLQPDASFAEFATLVGTLEGTEPNWTDAQLGAIDGSNGRVLIMGAEEDEAVNLAVPAHLHEVIPGSTLTMLPLVSHFAPVQDPISFAAAIEKFLA